MGWFNKKEEDKRNIVIPELPELPSLPDWEKEPLPQLPSFPSNSFGDKFSQSAIKEAIAGGKEVNTEADADEFDSGMMQKPLRDIPMSREMEVPYGFKEAAKMVKKAEPVFVRIDKFEKALETFEKTKEKIMEIEKMLKEIRRLKEKEEEELNGWQRDIQATKEQIERVDKELFSKIE